MKKNLFVGFIGFISANVYAAQNYSNVLAEHQTHVGFAPVEYRGTYKLQLLSNGVVQKVDNKNNTTAVAEFSDAIIQKLKLAVDHIQSDTLSKPEGVRCADAPIQEVHVYQTNGTNMKIWRQADCRNAEPLDPVASQIARFMNDLKTTFSTIDSLSYDDDENL